MYIYMDFKSELPENTRITVQYNEHKNGEKTEKTHSLRVLKDITGVTKAFFSQNDYGQHVTKVKNEYGQFFWLMFKIYKNGAIREIRSDYGGIPPSFLGYEHGETISDLKIIAIETPGEESIAINLRANHTGFQPQKIW